jgi:hypothetical protein
VRELRLVRVTLENKPGALARVVGIFASMGSNIETLAVAPDPRRPGLSSMALSADLDPQQLRWALGKINNLVNVIEAEEDLGVPARGSLQGLAPETGRGDILPSSGSSRPTPICPEV